MAQPDYATLMDAALRARDHAYVPYSRFAVGAAVLTANGTIFPGSNIENAAYPMTICAERVALFSAYAVGAADIVALAVVTDTAEVASPCGACRQVINELAPNAQIVLFNLRGAQQLTTIQALLPHGFGPAQLKE
ncbi:cytidine deaminase [Candidatus Gracilibacteria bacterium]|nr:cytidine deaminase [Candidatus Gracilibacteria bacterium]